MLSSLHHMAQEATTTDGKLDFLHAKNPDTYTELI